MIVRVALAAALASSPGIAQEPTIDTALVDACFNQARPGSTDPECIGLASAACQMRHTARRALTLKAMRED